MRRSANSGTTATTCWPSLPASSSPMNATSTPIRAFDMRASKSSPSPDPSSVAAAADRLGMHPQVLRPDELQLGRGETIADTAHTLSGFCAAIVMRTFAQATIDEMAENASVPVINALTDDHHPCQALADFLTLRETFGRLDGLRLAYIGDSDNVARSLMEAGALTRTEVVVAYPVAYEPEALEMRAVSEFVNGHHGHVSV